MENDDFIITFVDMIASHFTPYMDIEVRLIVDASYLF